MIWPFRPKPPALPDAQSLRLLCLQMSHGDIPLTSAFHDWIVESRVPMAAERPAGKVVPIGSKPGPEAA